MSTIEKALSKGKPESTNSTSLTNNSNEEEHGVTPPHAHTITIDLNELARKSMVTNRTERSRTNEEYRFIKRKILTNAFGKASNLLTNSNIVLISSTHPNEGKTFTSINLALSMALEQDKTVLLIDADVVNPSIGAELGYDSTSGLVDYLLGNVSDIGQVIYHTNIDKLTLIPAGSRHHLTHELLSSVRMEELMQELASRYPDRIILLDSPPLIGVSETQVLASVSGQAVIVVEENKTPTSNITKAVKLLDKEMAIGFVLNKSAENSFQNYGYGYGYGNYYGL
ncbi:XrtA-associated tyrosine autokinase [Psychrobium sp. 1_MG-2023]|uniref:XrtA-associated tyrosine autokinase n=1 Tax=Psychrobium sp. 1_MG-2023 TaxID=3062624 RepID=UPI000C31FF9C|nr:XrtA-associated tyrosine autokinase [Psychrobium sp. 1_MG-2023]MDP2561121.1 XrtA-associated tyrosine autokinase [Psychrobium sp. 1_MG-2023]PKF55097.1 exopolysaccharide biosynthesis protein [Alteromonadales bacterium alter-6D02]